MQVFSQAEGHALRTNLTLPDPLQVISRSLHRSCPADGSPDMHIWRRLRSYANITQHRLKMRWDFTNRAIEG